VLHTVGNSTGARQEQLHGAVDRSFGSSIDFVMVNTMGFSLSALAVSSIDFRSISGETRA
jgi:hypothetical protein